MLGRLCNSVPTPAVLARRGFTIVHTMCCATTLEPRRAARNPAAPSDTNTKYQALTPHPGRERFGANVGIER